MPHIIVDNLFAIAVMLLSLGASAQAVAKDDAGRAVYWLCAFGLNFAMTFLIKQGK